jgi:hypothetical protein
VAAEYGVVGLLLFLGVLGAAALGPQRMPWRGIGRALLAGWVLTSLLNSHFQTMNEGHMIFILLGAFLAPEEDVS